MRKLSKVQPTEETDLNVEWLKACKDLIKISNLPEENILKAYQLLMENDLMLWRLISDDFKVGTILSNGEDSLTLNRSFPSGYRILGGFDEYQLDFLHTLKGKEHFLWNNYINGNSKPSDKYVVDKLKERYYKLREMFIAKELEELNEEAKEAFDCVWGESRVRLPRELWQ